MLAELKTNFRCLVFEDFHLKEVRGDAYWCWLALRDPGDLSTAQQR